MSTHSKSKPKQLIKLSWFDDADLNNRMWNTQMRSHDKNLFGGHIRLHGVLQGLSEVLKGHFSTSWSRQLPGTNQDAEFIQHVTQGVFIYHKSVDECFRLNSIDPQTTAPFLKASMNTQDWRHSPCLLSLFHWVTQKPLIFTSLKISAL